MSDVKRQTGCFMAEMGDLKKKCDRSQYTAETPNIKRNMFRKTIKRIKDKILFCEYYLAGR